MAMVDVDDSSLPTGGLIPQVDWLGLMVGGHLALSLHLLPERDYVTFGSLLSQFRNK